MTDKCACHVIWFTYDTLDDTLDLDDTLCEL